MQGQHLKEQGFVRTQSPLCIYVHEKGKLCQYPGREDPKTRKVAIVPLGTMSLQFRESS